MAPKKPTAKKLSKLPGVEDVLSVIENNGSMYVDSLKEFVGVYSSPLLQNHGSSSHQMMAVKNAVDILKSIGADVEECYGYGCHEYESCSVPLVLASVGRSSEKNTVLVYCQLDGTGQDPQFPSSAKYIRGRAVIDAASFLIWIYMILAHKEANIPLPYNIKFCLDALSRTNVTQLVQVLLRRVSFLMDAEFCIACTSQALGSKTPDIIYGFRGICDFFIKIYKGTGPEDVNEDNTEMLLDVLYLLNSLVDDDGRICIEGLEEEVAPTDEEQRTWFSTLEFSPDKLSDYFVTKHDPNLNKVSYIERLWCHPSVIYKGIYPLEKEAGLLAGFTVLTVPYQKPTVVRKQVLTHLTKTWKQRNSGNILQLGMDYWAWPWRADQTDLKYRALADSISLCYGQWPQSILSGAHLPFPAILRKLTEKNVLVFTLGSFYDFQLTKDERLSVDDFIKAIKLVTRTLHFVEKTAQPVQASKPKAAKGKKK